MKIATIIVRVLIGLLLLFASLSFFFKLAPEPETTGDFKAFNMGLVASTYLLPLAKSIELLCGIAFVTGRYVTLANILILPITVNILFINYFLAPQGLPLAILLFLANLFLIYRYWDNYKSVFTR
ncbi:MULTISPECIES: DoxX family membrane protein [Flavobacterium]|jgi:putative oxidoreductase|uniref:DoxX family protein n=1 Tax=Flavobacterium tructae TaxID=1114873 RepID=A0A1S1J8B8_9FLAO|nr:MULTISPECIES: DoxX family membrane protein [Flavobacterium]MDL2141775.1 DoxX family membrane protein [Flavobacterium tructae]OHT45814.1 DoxX family protein [Flavobacterium tructae]OXB17075.1 DoxX family protein [Flavobacterium tructae]OXB23687.1 DoxX family protein [Flavobacterium tructae]URC14866.1 DoxX family membrane protein [Flavobacterium sp. B183]